MNLLEVSGLTKRFSPEQDPVVDHVSFAVKPGEIFGLLGPSGCGKTTTLRMIAGFETPDEGDVHLGGQCLLAVPTERRRIGIVFQDYALFPHLSVLKNVMFGLHRMKNPARRGRALEVLALVGLSGYENRMPDELSGGQQQRVALARAVAAEPELILLDEPFSNLDAALREQTRSEVRSLLKKTGMSAILVTHDQEEALSVSDRIGVMRDGRIEQIGPSEEVYHRPHSCFVAQFLGRTNVLLGVGHGDYADTPLGKLQMTESRFGHVLLSLRPEHVEPASANNGDSHGVVTAREFKGHDITYKVKVGGTEYLAHTEYTRYFAPGESVRLVAREPAVVLHEDAHHGCCEEPESLCPKITALMY
jgi:iron(III) transport system ATP-binding protein